MSAPYNSDPERASDERSLSLSCHQYKCVFFLRYQVGVARAQTATYRNLLTKLPGGSNPVENAYDAIEQKIYQVREYVDEWLRYVILQSIRTLFKNPLVL